MDYQMNDADASENYPRPAAKDVPECRIDQIWIARKLLHVLECDKRKVFAGFV